TDTMNLSLSDMLCPPVTAYVFPCTTLFRSHHDGSDRLEAHQRIDRVDDVGEVLREAAVGHVQDRKRPTAASRRTSPTSSTRSIRSEEHTSELQSRSDLVCRLLLEQKKVYDA